MQISRIGSFYNRFKRQLLSHVWLARILILGLTASVLIGGYFLFERTSGRHLTWEMVTGRPLPQSGGRTNFLILGSGGEGHDGSNLSDTMIFISVNQNSPDIALIPIPRDLWVNSLKAKINHAYFFGYEKAATAGGLLMAKAAVTEVINQPVHFALNIDFSTFSKAIDIIGGVDITIDKTFTDNLYPIPGRENDTCGGDIKYSCRYESITFEAGDAHLDGEMALKFVRSRHSEDVEEGTDFARSKRQTKVLRGFADKLLSLNNLKNTSIYKSLVALAADSVSSDIESPYYSTLFQAAMKLRSAPVRQISLIDSGLLINPPLSAKYQNQWVLIPKDSKFTEIFNFVSTSLGKP